jgi:hypothetical protein
MRLSIVVTCMGRLETLKLSAPLAWAQRDVNYVLVDYSCPQAAGKWVRENCPLARVVEVSGEKVFHLSKARNIGAKEADGDVLCFLDADVVPSFDFSDRLELLMQPGSFATCLKHSGMLCVWKDDFDRIGGYDEGYVGYGYEDYDIKYRLWYDAALQHVELPESLFKGLHHSHAARTQNYSLSMKDSMTRNGARFAAKLKQWEQTDRPRPSGLR